MPRESVIHSPAGIDQLPLYRFSNHFMAPSPTEERRTGSTATPQPTSGNRCTSTSRYGSQGVDTYILWAIFTPVCGSTYSRVGWRRRRGSRRHSTRCRASGCKIQPSSSHEDLRQYRRQPCTRRRRCNAHRRRKDGTRLPCRCRCRGVLRQVLQYLGYCWARAIVYTFFSGRQFL
jgi:hypothetical protein